MARTLIPIPNQPLRFLPYNEPLFCKKQESYCFLHQPDDPIRAQFKQTPCSDSVICPFDFTEGIELVTNGSFTGSAAGWTLGAGWTYNSNAIDANADNDVIATQTLPSVTSGAFYVVKFQILNYVEGAVKFLLGGGATTVLSSSDGTYSVVVQAGGSDNDLWVIGDALGDHVELAVDNISVKELDLGCWEASSGFGSFATYSNGTICHIPGLNVSLDANGVLTPGKYYKFQIVVSGRTVGKIRFKAGSITGNWIQANGTFTQYITSDGTDFHIETDVDFDGCYSAPAAYELKNDFQFLLTDLDGNVQADMSSYLSYESEYVTLAVDGLNALDVPYGCYKIQVEDECAENYYAYCGELSNYLSNCIMYRAEFSNTHLVIGNNNPDQSIKKYAFGFLFSSGFYLVQRLNIGFRKPKYPSKFDKGKYSDQIHYKNYVETDKQWEMVFGECSEIEHDAIAVQINCKEFAIVVNDCLYQYFNISDEYSPEWDAKGQRQLAEARIEVMPQGETLITSLLPVVPSSFLLLENGNRILLES